MIQNKIKLTNALALAGYLGTMAFLMLWIIWLAPPQIPKSIALAIALLPLLLPLRGIAFGIDAAIHRTEKSWLGLTLVALTAIWFFGCIYYSKHSKAYAAQNTSNENAA